MNSGERFDLMLCDLLNNPHGITLLDRTQQNCPRMPVIISTAPCCICTARFAVENMGASGILREILVRGGHAGIVPVKHYALVDGGRVA